ncbi:putative nuclease HARBI1 [Gigantopelta aegis]|uniref:putative nuclease HARBI1 n=1 Tax=Gigantopelta aegis TaxID=1735272 RepID=UPI001B88BD4A|nr:putative nuclease HARBI1 [Gigantopelta aegis]
MGEWGVRCGDVGTRVRGVKGAVQAIREPGATVCGRRMDINYNRANETTVCTVLKRVTNAIARLRPHYISFSNNEEMNDLKERFFNIAGFPNCVGAIDCSHIRIIGQGENGQRFINRKGWSSINVQAVSDSNRRFVNIVAHWHGSVHDRRIFDNSLMKQIFEDGGIDGFLIGDSGYPCLPYLMTPLLNPGNAAENRYNRALCSTRM